MTRARHPTRTEGARTPYADASASRPPDPRGARTAAVRVVREVDESTWSSFVRRHPDASVFHTPEMHRVFERARGHIPSVWAALDDRDEIRALLTSVSIATLGGPLRSATARNVMFAGPLVDGDPDALRVLLDAYRRGAPRALYSEIRNVVDPGGARPTFAACGFLHEPHLNFLIDLSVPEDELWGGVASAARRNIRRARRLGVTIETPDDAIDEAYPVLEEVYRRIRVPLPDRSLFDAARSILGPSGRFKVLLARLDGRTIGALTLLLTGDVTTYWYTGTLQEHRGDRPGDLLVAAALDVARSSGGRVFDFGGAGRPDEPYGVRDFKAKYGGRLVDLGRDVWVPSPFRLRVATKGFEVLRRFL